MAGWRKLAARTQDRGRRRGYVFSVRVTDEERVELEKMRDDSDGPRALGPFLLWAARAGITRAQVVPVSAESRGRPDDVEVLPRQVVVDVDDLDPEEMVPRHNRRILDLCAGTGSWSRPYEEAGYEVIRVSLPEVDVRTFEAPRAIWGVLAAPPCTEFSLAKNGRPREIRKALEVVSACVRLAVSCGPVWWALENPVGLLGHYLGRPDDVFEPWHFGDAWSKRTALWGAFTRPKRTSYRPSKSPGPPCKECGTKRRCRVSDHIAVTPPGFARAFFLANP